MCPVIVADLSPFIPYAGFNVNKTTMPTVRRFSRRKKRTAKAPTPQKKPRYPAKRKQWTDQQMLGAMEAASSNTVSINKALELYGVPGSTLKDRLSGRVVHGTKPGPKPYLCPDEEKIT